MLYILNFNPAGSFHSIQTKTNSKNSGDKSSWVSIRPLEYEQSVIPEWNLKETWWAENQFYKI